MSDMFFSLTKKIVILIPTEKHVNMLLFPYLSILNIEEQGVARTLMLL